MLEISIAAERIFSIGGFPVTNTLAMAWLVTIVLGGAAVFAFRRPQLLPAGIQNVFEFAVEGVLGLMEGAYGDRAKAEKYFPVVATIFLFILASNWLGIFPFLGSIGIFEASERHPGGTAFVPLFRSTASDLNFTLAIGVIAVFAVQAFGIFALGFKKHAGKYFSFRGPIDFFVGILEFFSEFAKILSFSFRLFGNIFAGEVLLLVVGYLVPYVVPLPFLILEVFVGFIQALVFAMLAMVFIGMATVEDPVHHST